MTRAFAAVFAALLIAFAASAAHASVPSEWTALTASDGVSITTSYSAYYCDASALERMPDGALRIWIKEELAGTSADQETFRQQKVSFRQKRGQSTEGWDRYSHTLQLYEFNCQKNQFRVLELRHCVADGTVLDQVTLPNPQWSQCAPGTVCHTVLEACCGLAVNTGR